MPTRIEISYKTVLFIAAFIALIWFILQVREIIFLIFVAFILMTAIRPSVEKLAQYKIPRALAVFLIYFLVFGVVGVSLGSAIPALVSQVSKFINVFPSLVTSVLPYWQININSLTQQLTPVGESVFKVSLGIFSNFINVLTVLVISFYFLMERRKIEVLLMDTFGKDTTSQIITVVVEIERRLGGWLRGQLLLMFIVFLCDYIGLTILRVDFALPLAVLAGLLEILPVIGPNIAAIPAILVGLTISPFMALSVAALYFLVQQLENNVFVPQVMRHSTGLPPVVTIIALMVGGRIAGISGAILAVPIVLVGQVVAHYLLTHNPRMKN